MSNAGWDPAVDPVLCSPYDPPDRHWKLDAAGQAVRGVVPQKGRRDPVSISIPEDRKGKGQLRLTLADRRINNTVKRVRAAVAQWRADGYSDTTATTLRLLHHWTDPQSMMIRPFFAQTEAIETLIWLREVVSRQNPLRRELETAAQARNDGIVRFCSKMATGTGKTAVMGMAIAWQTLNAARTGHTRNIRHTDRFAVFAPGHTVRERLGVLQPSIPGNVYDEMGLVPTDLRELLNRAKVRIINFQAFTQRELIDDSAARRLLGKASRTDTESWNAAVHRVLGDLTTGARHGVCVINDEAHHCYLPPTRKGRSADQRPEDDRAAVWFNAIRTMRDMAALGKFSESGQAFPVYDFSATPLWIDTASKSEPEQFQWVASDFGLMDAIESGLVKVPRVPIDDDSSRDETVWRNLYANTGQKNLKQWLDPRFNSTDVTIRLPEQLNGAVAAVVQDWERTLRAWEGDPANGIPSQPTPPVIIFVANKISNATALHRYIAGFEDADGVARPGAFAELSNVDQNGDWYPTPRTLVVHSKVAEGDDIPDDLKKLLKHTAGLESKKDAEAAVRRMLNTVGKVGQPGEKVRCVISVSMLTEGWDARTVTHVVGFRAFGTQLLCEQVTGRALRRTSYDALREPDPDGRRRLEPEYADVVGIPFEFMPDAGEPDPSPRLPKPRTRVHSVEGRRHLRVAWPQVIEYLRVAPQGHFLLDSDRVKPWTPPPPRSPTMTALAGVAGEESIISKQSDSDRQRTARVRLAAEVANRLTLAGSGQQDTTKPREQHTHTHTHTHSTCVRVSTEDQQDLARDGPAVVRGRGRASLFRSAYTAVGQWARHPLVALDDLWKVVLHPQHTSDAAEAILDACDFSSDETTRRARLGSPPVLDTAGIDFETTLEHIGVVNNSELSHAACHSDLELRTAGALDNHRQVLRWARNFQLGWTIPYFRDGVWRRYEPDFVAVLNGDVNLIVECKGVYDEKAEAAERWTREHWIPSVAGTTELPDELRRWAYTVIDDPTAVLHQLDRAITSALASAPQGGHSRGTA